MNFKKIMAGVLAGSMVAAMAVPAFAAESEYHGYLYFQTSSYSFRNVWNDGDGYGLGEYGSKNTDEITYDVVHAWGADNALISAPGTFTDVTITGDGTYTVSVEGLEWPDGETYNEIGLSTDMPWDITDTDGIEVTVTSVTIGDITFDNPETYNEGVEGSGDYTQLKVESPNYSGLSIGTYDPSSSNISITFTVSGMGEASDAGDTAPVVYLAAIVALAGVALVASKKARA